eukprot:12777776-Heterocapsa_arctica.AAC.1
MGMFTHARTNITWAHRPRTEQQYTEFGCGPSWQGGHQDFCTGKGLDPAFCAHAVLTARSISRVAC